MVVYGERGEPTTCGACGSAFVWAGLRRATYPDRAWVLVNVHGDVVGRMRGPEVRCAGCDERKREELSR